jgi:hypothetical protein
VANGLQSLHFRGHVFQFNTVYVHDNQKSMGYSAFRQMNWERPVRWLIGSVGPLHHVPLLGLQNPIQVKCDAGVGTETRKKHSFSIVSCIVASFSTHTQARSLTLRICNRPYVVGAGQFDVCHPVFAHLRQPGRASSTRNCTGWTLEGKTFDVLLVTADTLQRRVTQLEANLTHVDQRFEALEARLQSAEQTASHAQPHPRSPHPGPEL